MQPLGTIKTISFNLFDVNFTFNPDTILMSWIIIAAILIIVLFLRKKLSLLPGRFQVILEAIVGVFEKMLSDSLGKRGKKYLSFVTTLFVFVLICNWIALIPKIKSPTSDLNTTLGLALVVFIISHVEAIRKEGIKKYFVSYFKPFWFLFPSNVISEFSKVLSHSFRLYGNMFAGGIVIAVIPIILINLFKLFGIPLGILAMPAINAFFVIFIGAIQAFVFSVLAVAYISVLQTE